MYNANIMVKKVLFLAAEVAPFVKVGGLSQVMYFLPRALARRGLDVRVFTPKYGTSKLVSKDGRPLKLRPEALGLAVPLDGEPGGDLICNVLELEQRPIDAPAYLLENREYYELRENVYGYIDDPTRFALLSRGCLEWLRLQKAKLDRGESDAWWPDIVHCHDWHASYFIEMARRDLRYREMMKNVRVVLTVHNFKFQGARDFRFMREAEQDTGADPLAPLKSDRLTEQNILLRGLLHADAITTVSPTHAREVLTAEYAEGLDVVLNQVRGKLGGILNGLDIDEFNPATDEIIKQTYGTLTCGRHRAANKADLQRAFELPVDPDLPVLAFSGRLTAQKGIDLILEAVPRIFELRNDVQLVVLGTGDERFRNGFLELKEKFSDNVGVHLFADFDLPRKIFAGADAMLIPSAFEPGGIIALEALRYGCVPLVRRTGGLNDIVEDYDPESGVGNGFSFRTKSGWALYGAIIEALAVYRQPSRWRRLVKNAMASVVTWDDAAAEYDSWYASVIGKRRWVCNPIDVASRLSRKLGLNRKKK